jgi:DNA-binding response OmpR family regulator
MLPTTLALVDDHSEYADSLSNFLRERGLIVDVFTNRYKLLACGDPFGYDFYVAEVLQSGMEAVDLIKALRLRSTAGILMVSGRVEPENFTSTLDAGADMYVARPFFFETVAIAISAVYRRSRETGSESHIWRLDRRTQQLIAPGGATIDLTELDVALVECFLNAKGEAVTRNSLLSCLGQVANTNAAASLTATVYRLRRRIEKATSTLAPLRSKSRNGYVFQGVLEAR